MKVYIGNTAKNALGKVNQIWKSLSGIVLSNGTVAALVALGGTTNSNGDPAGSVVVSDIGPITQSRNRIRTALNETYAEATNTVTFSESDDIHEATCLVTALSGVVSDVDAQNYVNVVVNADKESVAVAMLNEADSQDSDTQIDRFLVGERFVIRSKTAITRLDFEPVDKAASMTNIQLWVGAH